MLRFLLPRPIAVLTAAVALALLGGVALGLLPVSLLPDVDLPEVMVQVNGGERDARTLEETVIAPLRRQLLQVNRLDDLHSETRDGSALIRLRFAFGTRLDYAFLEVNEAVDRLLEQLPRDLPRPNVVKASASDLPVFYLSLRYRDSVDVATEADRLLALSELAETVIRKRIEQLPEVAMVDLSGRDFPLIRIRPNGALLRSLGLTQADIRAALKAHDVQAGAILLREGQYQYNVELANRLTDVSDIRSIYLRAGARILQLGDLAKVSLDAQVPRGRFLAGGQPALSLAIIQQADVRLADLDRHIQAVLDQFEQEYPELVFSRSRDQAALLQASIDNLMQSLLWGVLLASLVMGLFLRSGRAALMIGISLPLSLLMSLLCFYLLGLSLNIISLSGLVLGIGLMIDNAIIVLDSIAEQRQQESSLFDACVQGTRLVVGPLISSALTTAAVFLPLVFLSGIAGALFMDQALAVSMGLGNSLLVAITLLPVLYHALYRQRSQPPPALPGALLRMYERGLTWVMRHPRWLLGLMLLMVLLGGLPAWRLPLQQLPAFTQDELLIDLNWNAPLTLTENERRSRELLAALAPLTQQQQVQLGEQQYLLDRSARQAASEATYYVQARPGVSLATLTQAVSAWVGQHAPQSVVSMAPPPTLFEQIFGEQAVPLEARLSLAGGQQYPGVATMGDICDAMGRPVPPLKRLSIIVPDQRALLRHGVTSEQVVQALQMRLQDLPWGDLYAGQRVVPVVLDERPDSPWQQALVETKTGAFVPLGSLVEVQPGRDYQVLQGGPTGCYVPLPFAISAAEQAATEYALRSVLTSYPEVDLAWRGALYERKDLAWELGGVLLGALALLYAILAMQFESLRLPLIVLLEVPIDISASLLTLWLVGQSLNLMAMIGMIVMSGIIINDSILKIDTINRLRQTGMPLSSALHRAGQLRLRPIVMTSMTTILAVLPFLWGSGLGHELQQPLAWALIGGMVVGTPVSLFVIPVLYRFVVRDS
jgi:multidrug efflux pump subunit AcrB